MAGSPGLALASEAPILGAIREALNLHIGVRVTRNNTGKLQDRFGRWVTFGLGLGSPDLVGAVTMPDGIARMFCLEVKSAAGKESPDQLAWAKEARGRGVFVATVRSVDEALAALERAKGGGCE